MSRFAKILLWIFSLFLVVIFLAIAAFPSWVSTPTGTKTAVKWINAHLKEKKLSVEKVKLSWFGMQRLEKVKFENEKTVLFSANLLETDTSLLYLALGGRSLNRTLLDTPYLFLSEKTSDEKEKEKEKKSKRQKEKQKNLPKFKDTLLIMHGTVVFTSEHFSPMTVSEIYVNKTLSPDHLVIQASTSQGNVQGSLDIEATFAEKIQAKVHIQDFPVAILDHVTESKIYAKALGPSLNLDFNLIKEKKGPLSINGSAQSNNLNGYIEGFTQNNSFIVSPQTNLKLTITPSFFKELIEEKQRGNWELASKTTLNIQIEKGIFPLATKFDYKDVILQAKATIDRAELHHATVGGYSLNQFDVNITSLNNLEISYKGEIQGKEATKLAGNVSITPRLEVLFDYTFVGFPVTLLELVSADLEKKVRLLLGSQFDLEGKGTFINKLLATQFTINSVNTKLTGNIMGNIPEMNFELSGTRQLQGDKTKVTGEAFNFALNGTGKYQEDAFSIPLIKGNIFNPHFELEIQGKIGEEGQPFSWQQMQLVAMGNIKTLPIEEKIAESALQNGVLYLEVDGAKNQISGKAKSQAVEASFEIQHFIQNEEITFEKADILFSCNLQDFPLSVVGPFIAEDLDLTKLFGKTLSLTSKGKYTPEEQPRLTLDVNAQSTGFSTSLSLAIDKTLTVNQTRPSYIYWEISPERFNALLSLFHVQPETTLVLTHPTQIELTISQFICPTGATKNLGHFLCQSGFIGDLTLGTMEFRSKHTNETLSLQGVTGSIKGENFSKAIDLSLTGRLSSAAKTEESTFSFVGQMVNFWTKEGKFNREKLSVKGELNLNHLPVRQLSGMFPLDHETRAIVQAVLGEQVNAHIHGEISQLTGPITIDVQSSNFKAKLPLQLQKNAFYLREYVNAEITLTEAVNETLLKDIAPLFITGIFSDHPLKVYIDPQGFVLPIRPYSLERVQIDKAIFDIGKIRVRNGGQVLSLLQFLNAKEISPDGLMEAWFTPIYMSLRNGVASYQRFDALLASNIHIALWGSINLINDNVNMTLAIAPTTLYERFKISGLTKKDMFQVQMTGTTSKLDLDWSSAYSRIAWIVARSAAGQLSNILGGILEHLISSPEKEIPPPTTSPFPWESFYPSQGT